MMLAALAALDDSGAREVYDSLRAAYNLSRPLGSPPVPPLEEWQRMSLICEDLQCRYVLRVAVLLRPGRCCPAHGEFMLKRREAIFGKGAHGRLYCGGASDAYPGDHKDVLVFLKQGFVLYSTNLPGLHALFFFNHPTPFFLRLGPPDSAWDLCRRHD